MNNIRTNNRSNPLLYLFDLAFFAFLVAGLQVVADFQVVTMFLCGAWFILALIIYGHRFISIVTSKRYLNLWIFLLFYFLSFLSSTTFLLAIKNTLAFFVILSPVLLFDIVKERSRRFKTMFLIIYTGVLLLDCIVSYQYLQYAGVYDLRGLGDDSAPYVVKSALMLVTSLSFIVPSYAYVFFHLEDKSFPPKKYKILFILLGGLYLLILFRAQYFTSILFAVGGALFAYSYGRRKMIVFSAAVIFLLVSFLPSFAQWTEQYRRYDALTKKINEIILISNGSNIDEASDFSKRVELSSNSWNTFLDNPFIGINYIDAYPSTEIVGNHASWVDSLAKFGLFAIPLFLFIYKSLRLQLQFYNCVIVQWLFCLLGFFNPVFVLPLLSTAFLYLPILLHWFYQAGYISEYRRAI